MWCAARDAALLCSEDVRTANVIACDNDGVDCLVLERECVSVYKLLLDISSLSTLVFENFICVGQYYMYM